MTNPSDAARAGIADAMARFSDKVAKAEAKARAPRKRRERSEQSESAIQAAIVKALRARGDVWVRRNHVGAGQYATGGVVVFGLGTGSADLLCTVAPSGKTLWLEVKTPTGRVSAAQLEFAAEVAQYGACYAVVRSVEDAINAVEIAKKGGL